MYVLNQLRQVLVSIPLAGIWLVMCGLMYLGWGIKGVDKFILGWNKTVEDIGRE
jgi:hypothetical protein